MPHPWFYVLLGTGTGLVLLSIAFATCWAFSRAHITHQTIVRKGRPGEAGVQGPAGSNGIGTQGPAGRDGVDTQGPTGNNVISIRGPAGSDGIGTQGPAGSNGIGIQGPAGSNGIGTQGPAGSNGIGTQGPAGSDGVGVQGPAGVGVQGPPGNDGERGVQGAPGSNGVTGTAMSAENTTEPTIPVVAGGTLIPLPSNQVLNSFVANGANTTFTVPTTGQYAIAYEAHVTDTTLVDMNFLVNGAVQHTLDSGVVATTDFNTGPFLFNLVSGDTLSLTFSGTISTVTLRAGTGASLWAMRIS